MPVTPSGADLAATARALDMVREAREVRGAGRPLALVVPSRVDGRTSAGREIRAALRQFKEPIGPAIGQRTAFVDAFTAGQWIGDYAPGSKAHNEILALARRVTRMLKPPAGGRLL